MKKVLLFIALFTFACVMAQTPPIGTQKKQEIKSEQISKPAGDKVWNKYCPIMGEEVNPKVKTINYKGNVIGFCCNKCIKKFLSNPATYLKNLSADGQEFIGKKEPSPSKK